MAGLQQSKAPSVGEEGLIQEPHTLSVVLKCLPREVRGGGGSRRQTVVYTCLDVSRQYLVVGSGQGYAWILDLHTAKLIRELSDFRGTAVTAVALNAPHKHIAFGTEDGQTKIDSFAKQMSKGYRIQEKERQTVVAMAWDHTGTTLLCAYSSGKLIKAKFQFAEEVMEVVQLLECGSCVVQLSLCHHSLLISTVARSLLLDIETGRVKQVGTKERKPGSFGGCLSHCSLSDTSREEDEGDPVILARLARPGLRMWTADDSGKVTLTTKFRGPLSSGKFPLVPTSHWSAAPGGAQFSESWQFSLVLPWLGGLVVTHSENTLWVLEPATSTIAGVLCLEHKITSVAVSGKFVYVLCSSLTRPLARFTAHPSFLKSLAGQSKAAKDEGKTEEEEDLMSLGSVTEGSVSGPHEGSSGPVSTRASEESERFKEGSSSEQHERNTSTGPVPEMPESDEAKDQSLATPGGNDCTNISKFTAESLVPTPVVTEVVMQDDEPVGLSRGTLAAGKEEEGQTMGNDVEADTEKADTLAQAMDTENSPHLLVPDSLDQQVEQADSHVTDPQIHTHPNSNIEASHPTTTNTQTTTQSTNAQQSTTGHPGRTLESDPPSVTGPTGVQDLAREVTDLLRPALGRLSTLMRAQDRRRGPENSGATAAPVITRSDQIPSQTASPRESPVVERRVGEGEGEGEGERVDGPGESTGGPSPKLILKLGGRLGELISGDRDKDRDSPLTPSATGSQSVAGVTPTAIGPEEEERRLRMSQAVGKEDAVSERLTQRKRRKKRTRKHSSKPSSASSSLERLTDIGDGTEGEATPVTASPQMEDTNEVSPDVGEVTGEGSSVETRKLSVLVEKEESVSSHQGRAEPAPPPPVATESTNVETTSQDDQDTLTVADLTCTDFDYYTAPPRSMEEAVETVRDQESSVTTSLPDGEVLPPPLAAPLTHTAADIGHLTLPEIITTTVTTTSTVVDADREREDTAEETVAVRDEICDSLTEKAPLSPTSRSQFVESTEVTLGNDPLSQLLDNDEDDYFKLRPPRSQSRSPYLSLRKSAAEGRESELGSSDGLRQLGSGDEVPLELSDNPLYYGDDTSDFTTDTESSQQRSRRGSSAKSQSRGSSAAPQTTQSSSTTFASKNVRTKGRPSLGVSQAVSDLSWEGSLQHSRPRSERVFTHSASPFEVSNSPVDLSSSYQSSSSNMLQVPGNKGPASLPTQQTTGLPSPLNLLQLRESGAATGRAGEDSGSDFSGEENEGEKPDQFSLCVTAVEERRSTSMEPTVSAIKKSPSPFSPSTSHHLSFDTSRDEVQHQEEELGAVGGRDTRESSPDPDADIWVTVPHPCRSHIQSICLSDHLLWLVDSRGLVYCTEINTKGKRWELIKHQMQQISSSASGDIVWGTYRQNAYVRQGVKEFNRLGNVWINMTKGTSLTQKIKCVCADEDGVWAVKIDGQIIFRKGVCSRAPQGRVWVEVGRAAGFMSVTACAGVVWATNASGRLFYRDGVTEQNPSGRKWVEMKAPPLEAVCMTQGNIAWIIDGEGKMGFRCGVTWTQPTGKNPWWEVTVSTTLPHSSLPFNSLWQVMTSEGSQFLSSVSSLIHTHLPGHHKLLAVSASNKAGVCVLESGSKLHACWRSTSGYHYSSASKDGVFQLTTWTMFGSGATGLWVVRDDGELYCVTPQDKFIRIECAGTIQMMTVSSTALWVFAKDQLWSRQGMSASVPEGISWDYIELSPQLHERKLKDIVCGKRAVWAVDCSGVPHFRFGVHSREPGTGMSPAWVPVDDLSHPLQQITVSNNDWLVWAIDDNCNTYVRTGVTPDFPVGTAWEMVPGQPLKQLCAHGRKVYALTPSGNLLCRYGITETNMQGNYWRQLPGNFIQINIGHGGVLLGLDGKGSILKQQCKFLTVSQDSEFLMHGFESGLDNSWEVV